MESKQFTQSEQTETLMVIKGANVFDGLRFLGQKDVEIKDGLIVRVAESLDAPKGVSVIDGQGKTLMPGLIDMHTHIFASGAPFWQPTIGDPNRTLSTNLAAGITTVLDMGGALGDLSGWENTSGQPAPTFAYAGRMFNVEGGHPSYMIDKSAGWPLSVVVRHMLFNKVEAIADAKSSIDEHKEGGASFIKLAIDQIPLGTPTMDDELIKPLVAYAQSQGLKVVVHIGSELDLMRGVRAGVDLFVHGPYRSDFSEKAAQTLAESQIPVVPTSIVFDQLAEFYLDTLKFGPLEAALIDPEIKTAYESRPDDLPIDEAVVRWFDQIIAKRESKFRNIDVMHAAKVPLFLGSDSPNVATVSGAALHQEIRLWDQKTALSNDEILSAGTGLPGAWLENYLGWKVGRIQPNYEADLILVDANLEKSLEKTESIELIWINGEVVKPNI